MQTDMQNQSFFFKQVLGKNHPIVNRQEQLRLQDYYSVAPEDAQDGLEWCALVLLKGKLDEPTCTVSGETGPKKDCFGVIFSRKSTAKSNVSFVSRRLLVLQW